MDLAEVSLHDANFEAYQQGLLYDFHADAMHIVDMLYEPIEILFDILSEASLNL